MASERGRGELHLAWLAQGIAIDSVDDGQLAHDTIMIIRTTRFRGNVRPRGELVDSVPIQCDRGVEMGRQGRRMAVNAKV